MVADHGLLAGKNLSKNGVCQFLRSNCNKKFNFKTKINHNDYIVYNIPCGTLVKPAQVRDTVLTLNNKR
jgi:hypothetical protein